MNAARNRTASRASTNSTRALFGHIGFTISNAVRSFVMALTHARFTHVPDVGDTKRYYQHIVRFSASFAFAVDVAMLTLGGYLKKKENLSARLGDVLSAMYLASMVLKHHENQGRPADDLPIVEWACRNQLYKAQEQLHDFLRNFPNRFLGWRDARAHLPGRPRLFGAERPARPQAGRRGAERRPKCATACATSSIARSSPAIRSACCRKRWCCRRPPSPSKSASASTA